MYKLVFFFLLLITCLFLSCSKDENPEIIESYFFDKTYHNDVRKVNVSFWSAESPPVTIFLNDSMVGQITVDFKIKPKICGEKNCVNLLLDYNKKYHLKAFNGNHSSIWDQNISFTKDCNIIQF